MHTRSVPPDPKRPEHESRLSNSDMPNGGCFGARCPRRMIADAPPDRRAKVGKSAVDKSTKITYIAFYIVIN
jgi:hypothetical protein